MIPAVLHQFRGADVESPYPLLLISPKTVQERGVLSLEEFLEQAVDSFSSEKRPARLLKDCLTDLKSESRARTEGCSTLPGVHDVLVAAQEQVYREMVANGLSGRNAERLRRDMDTLAGLVPAKSLVLPLSQDAPVYLLAHLANCDRITRRERLRQEIKDVKQQLLAQTKDGVDAKRRGRIAATVATLEEFLKAEPPAVEVLHHLDGLDDLALGCSVRRQSEPWADAVNRCDELAKGLLATLCALKSARLELADGYVSHIHDSLLGALDSGSLTAEEQLLLPLVIVCVQEDELSAASLGKLVSSGRPIHLLVLSQFLSSADQRRLQGETADAVDPAEFALGYRDVFVQQSSLVAPEHFTGGFAAALRTSQPAVHVVAGCRPLELGLTLSTLAGMECRAKPVFQKCGNAAGFDVSENSEPEEAWPLYPLDYRAFDGSKKYKELPLTLIDFAVMLPSCRESFAVAPMSFEGDDRLMPVGEYLKLSPQDSMYRIPFVWAADGDGLMHRLVVARQLILICRNRLRLWRTMQFRAGLQRERAECASTQLLNQVREQAAEKLMSEHLQQLEVVRAEAAAKMMQTLATLLVGRPRASG